MEFRILPGALIAGKKLISRVDTASRAKQGGGSGGSRVRCDVELAPVFVLGS